MVMETIFLILISLLLCFVLKFILFPPRKRLPPGPLTFPILGSLVLLRKSFAELEPLLRNLHSKYGPLVTLHIGPRPAVFVADRSLAHHALIQNGAVFADRPVSLPTDEIVNSNQHNISSAAFGPTWRLLRRNLTSEILHPSRIKPYSRARKWVLDILLHRLRQSSEHRAVVDHFRYAMFCLLVLMCFGDRLPEDKIKEIEKVQRRLLLSFDRYNILNFWPSLTKIFLRNKWREFLQLRLDQEAVLLPIIEARSKTKQEGESKAQDDEFVVCYVDSLLDLQLPEEKRKLDRAEIVSLCSEFLDAGTDTTSTAFEWIMANIVKYQSVQERVLEEIKEAVGSNSSSGNQEIREEDLYKMRYLKAVILEGLRRHPPGHFVLPHAVTEDIVLDGYVIPKNGSVNFMVAEMGWDPKVWEDPMAFKPERFLKGEGEGEAFDITGNREIKMMPFGAGRRICPGFTLAILHLEYFVANLVWNFEWKPVEGDQVDLSEKQEFTTVMKNPLQAIVSPRF